MRFQRQALQLALGIGQSQSTRRGFEMECDDTATRSSSDLASANAIEKVTTLQIEFIYRQQIDHPTARHPRSGGVCAPKYYRPTRGQPRIRSRAGGTDMEPKTKRITVG